MSLGVHLGRRLQGAVRLLPAHMRLPIRVAGHRLLGGLEPELGHLPELVARDRIALDIGANMGVYTHALAPLARHVHAFEPQPDCCATIAAWADGRNVTVHQAAVGAAPASLPLRIPVRSGRAITTRASFAEVEGPFVSLEVPVCAIDDLRLGPVGFIKVDVEGFESDVIDGGRSTLARDRPVLLVEIDRARHSRASFDTVVGALAALGYVPHVLRDGALARCAERTWETAEASYNFIFRPVEAVST